MEIDILRELKRERFAQVCFFLFFLSVKFDSLAHLQSKAKAIEQYRMRIQAHVFDNAAQLDLRKARADFDKSTRLAAPNWVRDAVALLPDATAKYAADWLGIPETGRMGTMHREKIRDLMRQLPMTFTVFKRATIEVNSRQSTVLFFLN